MLRPQQAVALLVQENSVVRESNVECETGEYGTAPVPVVSRPLWRQMLELWLNSDKRAAALSQYMAFTDPSAAEAALRGSMSVLQEMAAEMQSQRGTAALQDIMLQLLQAFKGTAGGSHC